MSVPLRIREATGDDAFAISALVLSLARSFVADPEDPGAAEPFFRTLAPEAIAESLAGGRFRYHLAEVDGALVGVVGVRDHSHLFHLFVAESFHRRGIGRRLWEVARDAARADGNPGRFTVNSSLFAVPVYRGLGFEPAGEPLRKDGIAFVPMQLVERPAAAPALPEAAG